MLKRIKSVSMLLALAGVSSTGVAYAVAVPEVDAIQSTQQQTSTCTGVVKDATGETVIGASVVVKGTTNGTITGLNGDFSLQGVKKGDIIQISFVGYQTQEITWNGQAIDITLKDDTQTLDEVVVTALGMKRAEKALGYAVTEVKGEELKAANTISPVAALQGKVAGVEIAQSDGGIFGATKIQIRGASSLSGNNQPIYVVDGVILDNNTSGNDDLNWTANPGDYGNELKNLNADDFASVSVLKGAAATALYGSRGLNGAVVITTKSGKGVQGFGVSLSQTFGWDVTTATPDIQTEYGYGLWPGERSSYGNRWDPNGLYQNAEGVYTLKGAPYTTYGWGPKFDGREMENYDGTMTTFSPYENGMKEYFQTGFNTNTNVSIRGGNDKVNYYSSLSYKKVQATTSNNTFERYAFLLKGSYKISDKLDVAGSVSFSHSKPRNAAQEIGLYFVYSGIPNFVNPGYWSDKYKGEHGGLASTSYGDLYGYVPSNVKALWWNLNEVDNVYKEYVIRPTFEVNYKITDWVSFKAEANMNVYTQNYEGKSLGSGYANEGGAYGLSSFMKEQFTTAGTFTFNKTIKDFTLGGFLRGEYYNKTEQYMSLSTSNGLIVPGQYFIGNSKDTPSYSGKIQGTKRMMSAVFAINTSWKDQVYLDITGRNDWSSALVYANKTGNHSYFYPSVSGSWLVNNTIKMPSWISLAKLRASWAQVGNDTDPYAINQGYSLGTIKTANGNIYTNQFSSSTLYALDLKPERKNSWEVGLDFRVLNDRICLDATYYKENTKDQILSLPVPSESGIDNQMVNAGNIQNQGVEIALNTVPFRNKDWEWGVDLTFTKNVSKIVELHESVGDYYALRGQVNLYDYRIGSVARVGGAYGLLMSDIMPKRDENGNILLTWEEYDRAAYALRSGQVEVVGDMNPDFLASLSTSLRYKNWNLRVALDARVGGLVAIYANRYGTTTGYTGNSLKYRDAEHGGITWTSQWMDAPGVKSDSYGFTYTDGVIPEGVFAQGTTINGADGNSHDVSGMSYQACVDKGWLEPMHAGAYHYYRNDWSLGIINDDWVHELSYIALREITIGYNFPKSIAKKIGAKGLGCSLTGRNLCYLYNSLPNNVNPESVRGNSSGEFRIRSYNPYTANFMFTINVDF